MGRWGRGADSPGGLKIQFDFKSSPHTIFRRLYYSPRLCSDPIELIADTFRYFCGMREEIAQRLIISNGMQIKYSKPNSFDSNTAEMLDVCL